MKLIPCINLDSNCSEAMDYYAKVFDGEIIMKMTYREVPEEYLQHLTEDKYDLIMHGEIKIGDQLIYFSDYIGVTKGDIVSLNIECESEEEIKKYYERLKEESKVEMELQDTFWGAKFAHLIDKFGVNWSLNYQKSE